MEEYKNKMITQEKVDRLVKVLQGEDHDCHEEDCAVCNERLEEEAIIKDNSHEL